MATLVNTFLPPTSAFARFVTADWSAGPSTVPYAHFDNPQTLNLYSYVDNNPINGIDADGHAFESIVGQEGGWGLDTMMSSGSGNMTEGENGAAIDAMNAEIAAYNQAVDAYNESLEQSSGGSSNSNAFVQAGLDNARNALLDVATAKLSSACSAFVNETGDQAPRQFTASSLQAEAKAAAAFIYDGASSKTLLKDIGYDLKGTVGDFFKKEPDVMAISQSNGHAIFVRSSELASTKYRGPDGKPTAYAKAAMMHETMHKFGYTDAGMASKMLPGMEKVIQEFGSMVIVEWTQMQCYP